MADLIRLCGLFKNISEKSGKYLSGVLGGAKVFIFRNIYKREGDRQPDYFLFLGEAEKSDRTEKKASELGDGGKGDDA